MKALFALYRFAAHQLYTGFAWAYDLVAWMVSMGQWRAWQQVALQELPAGRVLEIGFGPGHLLVDRARESRPMVGVDRSRQMVRLAARRVRRAGFAPALARADVARLPFSAARFDGILSTFPAEFIVDGQVQRELHRILLPGGRLVIIPMARITGVALLDRLAAALAHGLGEDRLPPPSFLDGFRGAGFEVAALWVTLPRGKVLEIIATRPEYAPRTAEAA